MCTLTNKTRKKTVTVYKVAYRNKKGEYLSCFAGCRIKLGTVIPQTFKDYSKFDKLSLAANHYNTDNWNYNKIMVGKTSGFAELEVAQTLARFESDRVVLKMTLGGEIWKGTSQHISRFIDWDHIIYAGTEVLSFEEIE